MNAVLEPCAKVAIQARFQFFPGTTESQVAELQSGLHRVLTPELEIVELHLQERLVGRGHAERMRFISFFRKGDSIFLDQQVDVYTVTDRIGGRFNRRMSVVYRLHDSELIFHVEDRLNGFTSAVVALPARDLHHRPYFRDWMEELILPGAIFLAPFSGR